MEEKKKSDSEFLSFNLMLNSGKKFRALRDHKNKYSNSCTIVVSDLHKKKDKIKLNNFHCDFIHKSNYNVVRHHYQW
jgi:hypothetical protein